MTTQSILLTIGLLALPASNVQGKSTCPKPAYHVYQVGGGISRPKAAYTPDPHGLKRRASAVLQVTIDPEGHVACATVYESSGYKDYDKNALDGVKQWRFLPAVRKKQPVAVRVLIEIKSNPKHH